MVLCRSVTVCGTGKNDGGQVTGEGTLNRGRDTRFSTLPPSFTQG